MNKVVNGVLQNMSKVIQECDIYLATLKPGDPDRQAVEEIRSGAIKVIEAFDER